MKRPYDHATAQLEASPMAGEVVAARLADDSAQLPPCRPLVSIIVPVFNEEDALPETLARLRDLPLDNEIILVDDGSTDGTSSFLAEIEQHDRLKIYSRSDNRGKGAAIRDGLALAEGDFVLIQDADLEYNPDDIPAVMGPLIEGEAQVVYGSRFLEQASKAPRRRLLSLHRSANGLLTRMSNLLNGQRLTDMETGYKAFQREVIEGLDLQENRFGVEPEITAKLARRNVAIVETPISYNRRTYAEGKKIGPIDAIRALYCIVRYRFF